MTLHIAVGLYCLVGALLIYGGINYLTLTEFMPYHAQAVGTDWLYFMNMHTQGGPPLAVGLTVVTLTVLSASLAYVGRGSVTDDDGPGIGKPDA